MKETFKIHVLGDRDKSDILNKRYSFIEKLGNGWFAREDQEREADFFVIDLDHPPKNIAIKTVEGIEKRFCCRPIIFASFDPEKDASAKAIERIPHLKN